MVNIVKRMRILKPLLRIRAGPGAAILPLPPAPQLVSVHLPVLFDRSNGARPFWRTHLQRLKYHNPSLQVTVSQSKDLPPSDNFMWFRFESADEDALLTLSGKREAAMKVAAEYIRELSNKPRSSVESRVRRKKKKEREYAETSADEQEAEARKQSPNWREFNATVKEGADMAEDSKVVKERLEPGSSILGERISTDTERNLAPGEGSSTSSSTPNTLQFKGTPESSAATAEGSLQLDKSVESTITLTAEASPSTPSNASILDVDTPATTEFPDPDGFEAITQVPQPAASPSTPSSTRSPMTPMYQRSIRLQIKTLDASTIWRCFQLMTACEDVPMTEEDRAAQKEFNTAASMAGLDRKMVAAEIGRLKKEKEDLRKVREAVERIEADAM